MKPFRTLKFYKFYDYLKNTRHAQSRPVSNNDFDWLFSRADLSEKMVFSQLMFSAQTPKDFFFINRGIYSIQRICMSFRHFVHVFWMWDCLPSGQNFCMTWENLTNPAHVTLQIYKQSGRLQGGLHETTVTPQVSLLC